MVRAILNCGRSVLSLLSRIVSVIAMQFVRGTLAALLGTLVAFRDAGAGIESHRARGAGTVEGCRYGLAPVPLAYCNCAVNVPPLGALILRQVRGRRWVAVRVSASGFGGSPWPVGLQLEPKGFLQVGEASATLAANSNRVPMFSDEGVGDNPGPVNFSGPFLPPSSATPRLDPASPATR
jgi:hypothetical protein